MRPRTVGLLAGLAVVLATSCTLAPPPPSTDVLPSASLPPSATTPPPATPTKIASGKLKLGTVAVVDGAPDCGNESSCQVDIEVMCPDVKQPVDATLYIFPAEGTRGVVVQTLGGLGTGSEGVTKSFLQQSSGAGFENVVLSWTVSWEQSAPGEQVGPKHLACRAATAILWIYDNVYRPMGLSASKGRCGFCLLGNSGGASQIAYALSFYGLGQIVNAAIMSGGPPHAAMQKGCLQEPGYAYDDIQASIIDLSYGGITPCQSHDPTWAARWAQDSVDTGGVYLLPKTRMWFIFVSDDPTVGPAHGQFYVDALTAARSPMVKVETVPGAAHTIQTLPDGRDALLAALDA
jgi:hypothetical protein